MPKNLKDFKLNGSMFQYSSKVIIALDNLDYQPIQILMEMIKSANQVWIIGNGGSMATASHFAEDLVKLAGVKAFSISDPPLMTMSANDYGLENMFRYPLKRLAGDNDLVIGLTMGGSDNVLVAISSADLPGHSFIITKGTKIKPFPNSIVIPTDDIQVAEDVCLSICHMVCRFLKESQ